jgi:hypothetical protein
MEFETALIIFTILIAVFLGHKEYIAGPRTYRNRKCQGKTWKVSFPDKDSDEIRLFLSCLVNGMALSEKTKMKFNPDDKAIEIYKSLYGGKVPLADNLECETFVESLAEEFGQPVDKILEHWSEDVTLGELFAKISP